MSNPSIWFRSESVLIALLLLGCIPGRAEFFSDKSFISLGLALDFRQGSGLEIPRTIIVPQPDGKIIVVGSFYGGYSAGAVNSGGITRRLENGTLDASFVTGRGIETITNGVTYPGGVNALAVQADGKILIGGNFTHFDTKPVPPLIRLNVDGAFDATFDPGPLEQAVVGISVRPGGKILVAGAYPKPAMRKTAMMRLNADGSLDPTFVDTSLGFDGAGVQDMTVGDDGKPVIAIRYVTSASKVMNQILRFNADGGLDSSFAVGAGTQNPISRMVLQPDGKILVSVLGADQRYDGVAVKDLFRLNKDGALDAAYHPDTTGPVLDMIALPEGLAVIRESSRLAKLNADGSRATSAEGLFPLGTLVVGLALDNSGRFLVGNAHYFGFGQGGYYVDRWIERAPLPPVITLQPSSIVAAAGTTRGFIVRATSGSPFTYQWQFNQTDIIGATNSELQVWVEASKAGVYRVIVTNEGGSVASSEAMLTIGEAPKITAQPAGVAVALGQSATFSVSAAGTEPMAYQWYKDYIHIPAATNRTYTIASVQAGDLGTYFVEVMNPAGLIYSSNAKLTIAGQPIQFAASRGTLTLTWPAGYRLQTTSDLKSGLWTDLASSSPATIPTKTGHAFYRSIKK